MWNLIPRRWIFNSINSKNMRHRERIKFSIIIYGYVFNAMEFSAELHCTRYVYYNVDDVL